MKHTKVLSQSHPRLHRVHLPWVTMPKYPFEKSKMVI